MEGLCLIISGGEFSELPDALTGIRYVIACDRGWKYAQKMNIEPDLIVGDFDSAPQPVNGVPIERFPTRKDDTDTMLAVRHALDLGYRDIAVCCAFGGRLDHTFSNIQTGVFIASHGGRALLIGKDTETHIFTRDHLRIPRKEGWSLSVFALSDICEDVIITGTKYTCENVTLTNAFPLGVSNTWESETAYISVGYGILMVMCSKLKKGEHI